MFRIAKGFLILALLTALLGFSVRTDYSWGAAGLVVVIFAALAGLCFLRGMHVRSRLWREKTNLTRLCAWRRTRKSLNNGGIHT